MATMDYLDLGPYSRAQGTIRLPGSKSISNRVLLLAALAEGETTISNLLDSDDTRVMLDALEKLGVKLTREQDGCVVQGTRGAFTAKTADLFLGNAGTAIRPLTAALAVNGGDYRVHGVPRMHERPIGDLVDGLRQIGARIDYEANEGYPPLRIRAGTIAVDEPIRVRGDVSSQFLTALLMTLPLVRAESGEIVVEVEGELISKPYIEITIKLMERFGVTVARDGWQRFTVPAGVRYRSPGSIMVEGDASSASYFLAAGAIAGGPVRVVGVGRASIQGDVRFADALTAMGANVTMAEDWIEVRGVGHDHGQLEAIDMDFNLIPDAAMTIAVCALFARRHDHAAQHRQLAREGNRPDRGDGRRIAQGRRDDRRGRRLPRRHAACEAHAERGDRHLRRSPHGDVLLARLARRCAGANQRPEVCRQDLSRLFRPL